MPNRPLVKISFIESLLNDITGVKKNSEGPTTIYVLPGKKPVHKRMVYIRALPGGLIDLERATGIAVRIGKMPELLRHLEAEHGYKDGGYTSIAYPN
jgi:hypothetical protein